MSGVSAVIQNLYSSTDSTVAYFVHFVSVPQVQAAHVAEAGYNTGLQSLRGTAMVHHANKHACNSLQRTFEIVPVCPTGHDNEKLCTFKYIKFQIHKIEGQKNVWTCTKILLSFGSCAISCLCLWFNANLNKKKLLPRVSLLASYTKVKQSNRSISRVLKFRDFPSSYQSTQILFDKRSSNGKIPF